MILSREHQHTLLNIAKWSIQDFLETRKRNPIPEIFDIDDMIMSTLGAFISVYVNNDLRGCIGTFSESEPLFENVHHMSLQAAFEDNRFKALCKKDIPGLRVEISVLSPRIRINSPDDIVIGKHGIYLIHGIRRATLLPQVAIKNKWSAIEFLECCAKNKLGMHKDSWKEAELFVYEAIVFS